jgi:hypothetical protein
VGDRMNIHNLSNTLDGIWLSSKKIEEQIEKYRLSFIQLRVPEIEYGIKVPIFVLPFYSFVLREDKIPTQEEFWKEYCLQNKEFFNKVKLNENQKMGLKARTFRTYPSLVRDIHLGTAIRQNSEFDDVFYNEVLDVEYGIDLVVKKNNKHIGLNLFTNTKNSIIAREKKQYRPKKQINLNCIELPIDFRGSKTCGDFFLYSDKEISTIKLNILSFF